LAERILSWTSDGITIDAGKRPGRRDIAVEFTDDDARRAEEQAQKFMDRLPTLVDELSERMSRDLLTELKRRWRKESRQQQRELGEFRKRLQERWGAGVEALRMLVTIAREYGSEMNVDVRSAGGGSAPKAFDVLIKLHARACTYRGDLMQCSPPCHGTVGKAIVKPASAGRWNWWRAVVLAQVFCSPALRVRLIMDSSNATAGRFMSYRTENLGADLTNIVQARRTPALSSCRSAPVSLAVFRHPKVKTWLTRRDNQPIIILPLTSASEI
jgi:hypothetical protein